MIKVDKGIPIPERPRKGGGHKRYRYPWDSMEIGDSFFIEGGSATASMNVPSRLIDKGWRFSVRTIEGGVRIWRIK